MIQEHGRRELVGRGRRSRMPNERSDVGRCGEMHDAEQNEEHPTSLKQPNTSRCRHDQTRMTKRITSGLTRKSCSCGSFEPDLTSNKEGNTYDEETSLNPIDGMVRFILNSPLAGHVCSVQAGRSLFAVPQ